MDLFSPQVAALSIFLLPVAVFAVMALLHNRIPRHGDWLATGTLGVCLALALLVFRQSLQAGNNLLFNVTFDWLPVSTTINLGGGFMVDRLAAIMLVVVTLVSFLVHLFSIKYMEGDVRYGRFYCCLLLFSASMLGLVLANNLLFLFMAWELVGLSSYLLIGHWYEKKSASNAAIKAFITTRIGDLGMFIGVMICYWQVGSLQYADIFAAVQTGVLTGDLRTVAALGIFFGAMGKSAQFPLHVWLPDAMEGPTPVSALIHAATMVAAGVYLTGRMLPLFDDKALIFVAAIGGFTALFAASIALVQDDIKKVLAYSTVSQLGYMILALGVGGYVSGLFHLTTHAFFKAGLFLGSGAVIYAMHHEQSLSKYGGLFKKMPKTAICYLLCTLALAGFPGFSGFWSKDAILADVLVFSRQHGFWFLPVAAFSTVFMTAFYMFRQYFLTFTGKPRDHHAYEHAHEVPWQMLLPLIILGFLAVVGGGFGKWFEEVNPKRPALVQIEDFALAGATSPLMIKALAENGHNLDAHSETHEAAGHPAGAGAEHPDAAHGEHLLHQAHSDAMLLSTILGLLGIALGALMYFERRDGSTVISPAAIKSRATIAFNVLWNKYYMDELYNAVCIAPTRWLAAVSAAFDRSVIDAVVNAFAACGRLLSVLVEIIDRLVVDGVGVLGPVRLTAQAGEKLSYSQTGYVRQYLTMTAAGIVLISVLLIVFA